MSALLHGDSAALAESLRTVESESAIMNTAQVTHLIAATTEHWAAAERVARAAAVTGELRDVRVQGHVRLGELEIARGRWAACRQTLANAGEIDPGRARIERARLASLPHLAVPAADLASSQAELAAWIPTAAEPDTPAERAFVRHQRLYLLGLLNSKLGESEIAIAYADSIEALPDVASGPGVPTALAAIIRADVAWRGQESPDEVLRRLAPVRGNIPATLWNEQALGEEHGRYLRAEALHAAGRDEEALRWLRNGFENTPGWVVYKAPVRHLTARVQTSLGNADEAGAARAAFEGIWEPADAPIALEEGS